PGCRRRLPGRRRAVPGSTVLHLRGSPARYAGRQDLGALATDARSRAAHRTGQRIVTPALDVVRRGVRERWVWDTVGRGGGGWGRRGWPGYELALRHGWACKDRSRLVWWVTADTPAAVEAGLAGLAYRLLPALQTVTTPAEAAGWAVGWLQTHRGSLLVL